MAKRSSPYQPDRPIVVELASGGVVLHPGDARVLLLHETEEDRWTLPKGHVEKGESLEACARREIQEETGLTDLALLAGPREVTYRFFQPKKERNVQKVVLYFLFRAREDRIVTEEIFDRHAWEDLSAAVTLVSHPTEADVLRWSAGLL